MDDEFKLTAGTRGVQTVHRKIRLSQACDNEIVVYEVRYMAARAGFNSVNEFTIASAASELATNILRYAGKGEMDIRVIRDPESTAEGIELFASDEGPGIRDVDLAMQERYSSLPNSLGLGLPSVKRNMDEFYIESIPGKGTRILARKWKTNG